MTDKKGYHRRKKKLFQHRQVCLGACWQFTTAMIVKSDVTWAVDPRDASLLKRRGEGGGEDKMRGCGGAEGNQGMETGWWWVQMMPQLVWCCSQTVPYGDSNKPSRLLVALLSKMDD